MPANLGSATAERMTDSDRRGLFVHTLGAIIGRLESTEFPIPRSRGGIEGAGKVATI